MSICAVLLYDHAFTELGEAITPYVQHGKIGRYIYCASAEQNGNFIDMTFDPEHADGTVRERMVVSIPVGYVKFMATGVGLPIGFGDGQES